MRREISSISRLDMGCSVYYNVNILQIEGISPVKKKLLALLLCAAMLAATLLCVIAKDKIFTDVSANSWYTEAVNFCVDRGILSGTSDTTFEPHTGMTRSMFVTMLASYDGADLSGYTTSSFKDVRVGSWYNASVEWAYENKIVSGTGGGYFSPKATVTRQEIALMLYTYTTYKTGEPTVNPSDKYNSYADKADISSWAETAMKWACGVGLFDAAGYEGDLPILCPKNTATRAQVALIMMQFSKLGYNGSGDADSKTYKHVVIVGVDGAGTFFKEAKTPNLDEMFENGAVTYEAITSTPSISAQSWGSMFHGVTPEFHGLDNDITASRAYPADSEFPSFFRVVREQMPEASLASFCNWNNINIGIIEDDIGVKKDTASADLRVIVKASNYVKQEVENGNGAPTVLFIHLDEADATGHSSGYGSDFHIKKIELQDEWIRRLYDTYDELGLLKDTLFIVTTDHGGLETNHGGDSDAEMKIMFAAAGKTVEKGTIGEMGIRDTASIVLHALGLNQPASWTSRVPSGLFKGVVAGERPVFEENSIQ